MRSDLKAASIALVVLLATVGCLTKKQSISKQDNGPGSEFTPLLTQLTSTKESERFAILERAEECTGDIGVPDVEQALTSLRRKNVSTLVFVLMKADNDVLYRIGVPARMTVENSEGSFPNIAYYYARVSPQKGFHELVLLYKKRSDERLAICKAIGEVGTPEASEFLMAEARMQADAGNSMIPFLAGLQSSSKAIDVSRVAWFLEQELDREEIILLSHLKTRFMQKDLIAFYDKGGRKRTYAIQHIFSDPAVNLDALRSVVTRALENNQHDTVRQWMMSDSMRGVEDQRVKEYRESVLDEVARQP